jgi:hypothetical protein
MNAHETWKAERNKALETLDMDFARRMMPGASSDDVRLMSMHKGRYECIEVADALRSISGEWLRSHGFGRIDGTPILPAGELPK